MSTLDFGEGYKVLRKLGEGGMAELFLAEARVGASRRLVVIKRISRAMLADAESERMFRNEMHIAAQLSHPNIAQLLEIGTQPGGASFFVMEFVHGEDIERLAAEHGGPLPPAVVTFVAAQIAAGLHHAHDLTDIDGRRLQVVHRDVTPHNIRVSYEGAVKLLDFGVAKTAVGSYVSQQGSLKGKFPYLAPEQVEGLKVDGRADIFSLGIVIYELLTGRPLFGHQDPAEILDAILTRPISAPSLLLPEPLPPGLDDCVLRALARDTGQRFQSARELQLALEQIDLGQRASSVDLEQLMRLLFGDGKQRLAELVGRRDDVRQETRTIAAVPSRKLVLPSDDSHAELEPFYDEDAITVDER